MRPLLLALATLFCSAHLAAQTYFYIDEIQVQPSAPTETDDISIDLIGGLSSTGAYVASASAEVTGNVVTITIAALDPGGGAVIVPHTETVPVGNLPQGTYTIAFQAVNVGDFAPSPQHQFTVAGGGLPCDDLEILSVQWPPFTDEDTILVHVANSGSELFDYANFILFDANGDTLAKEIDTWFGLPADSWHALIVHEDAVVPEGPFNGTLELWTDIFVTLACSWDMDFNLCPSPPCAPLEVNVQNLGGALAIGSYAWTMMDADMNIVGSGTLAMTAEQQFDTDNLCLPPGDYYLACSAQQPPTGGAPYYSVSLDMWVMGPSQPVSFDLPVLMPFSLYPRCADGTNGITEEENGTPLRMAQDGNTLNIQRVDGAPLGAVDVHDAQGLLLHSASFRSSSARIELPEARGLVLVRVGGQVLRTVLIGD